jgi:hypothetical protein
VVQLPTTIGTPSGSIIKRDFVGPSGNDEPAAMILSRPGDRKFYVVGYSNRLQPLYETGDDFYVQKYKDITP